MKVVIQRVNRASVLINGKERREINKGLVCFFCACAGDKPETADKLAEKTTHLRIFSVYKHRSPVYSLYNYFHNILRVSVSLGLFFRRL